MMHFSFVAITPCIQIHHRRLSSLSFMYCCRWTLPSHLRTTHLLKTRINIMRFISPCFQTFLFGVMANIHSSWHFEKALSNSFVRHIFACYSNFLSLRSGDTALLPRPNILRIKPFQAYAMECLNCTSSIITTTSHLLYGEATPQPRSNFPKLDLQSRAAAKELITTHTPVHNGRLYLLPRPFFCGTSFVRTRI